MTEVMKVEPVMKKWFWQKLMENPVTVKELRSRMRGRRAFVVLTVYLLLMGGFISLVYVAFVSSTGYGPYGPDPREAGKTIFASVTAVQAFLVTFIGPAFTAGTVSGEKERQTYDLLRTTLLSAESFVIGKLFSALSYVLLLVFAAIPLQSIAFLLGGVSPAELIVSQLIVIVAAVAFALYGLYCSTVMKTTLAASVTTFGGALFVTVGIPMLIFLFGLILSPIWSLSISGWVAEMILAYGALGLAATNLPATLVATELFLMEEDALLYFSTSFSGHTVWMVSPWPLFLLFYGFLAFILYQACVRRVRRIADK